jgi:antitoxin MazE
MRGFTMKAKIVRIGNSQGIRLPRPLLDAAGLDDDAEVSVEARAGELVVRAVRGVRDGWASAFAEMAAAGDDQLLDPPTSTEFDRNEWVW